MEPIMAYPFAGTGVAGVFDPKSEHEAYSTALQNILTTPLGSVPYDPNFGSVLPLYPFDLNDVVFQSTVLYYAYEDIQRSEPRLRVVDLQADFAVDAHTVKFVVSFIEYTDPTETVRQENVGPIEIMRP